MPDYRLYLLNPHSGHIDGVEEFHSSDHVEAICMIGQKQRPVPTELWCGRVKVAHFEAEPQSAARVRVA